MAGPQSIRNPLRLLAIAGILARHDALFPLEMLGVSPALLAPLRLLRRREPGRPLRPGQRLAHALAALGPSFIKLGQALATRSDLLGEELAADLSELQDRLPPFPGEQAVAIIEQELGRNIGEVFSSFDLTPVAAASIAQVHFATTAQGAAVAVKVLRPGIERAFARDLDLFYWLARGLEKVQPRLRRLKPTAVVDTLAETVQIEMDLRMEAAAASELRQNFAGDPSFRVPKVDWLRTARRVLTLERIAGIRIDDRAAIVAAGHDPDAVLTKAANAMFNQVFRDGFFHADLHPGNLFVQSDGSIAAVDFGIMGRIDRDTRDFLADMLVGFLNGDYPRVAAVHFRAGYVPADQSLDRFTQACRSIGEPILGLPLHEISIARLLGQLFEITEDFEMETQPQLLLLQKTMLLAEGVGRTLNDRVNMWTLARPLIEDWMRRTRSPEARLRRFAEEAVNGLERLPRLLRDLERAAAMMASGGIHLHPDSIQAVTAGTRERYRLWPVWLAIVALAIAMVLS